MTSRTKRKRWLRVRRWIGNILFVLAAIALGVVLYVRLFDRPAQAPLTEGPPVGSGPAQVTQVLDGDTIDVLVDGNPYRVRYIGIDTPELGESLADLATARNRALVTGKTVQLVKDVSEVDRYGRLLRYVYLPDGSLVNEILVQEGLASVTLYAPDTQLADLLRDAEERAQNAKLGIWAEED